jgi:hypothetical protein
VSPALPPPTREELAAERARQIRSLRLGAVVVGIVGALVSIAGAGAVALGHTPLLLGAGVVATIFAGVTGARSRLRSRAPLPNAPAHAELPDDDPRKAVPLAHRRRTYVLAAVAWAATLTAAGLGVWALGPGTPALIKLALFLGAPGLALAVGARIVRRRNGTTSWPH